MRIIRSSLTRLFRTPVKTALFFLLLSFTVALVCAGGSLWKLCGDNLRRFEEIFMTIGTVEQTPERMEQEAVWYANLEDFRYFNRAVYGEAVSSDVLDFEGAGYLSGPEQRAYYEALEDYQQGNKVCLVPDRFARRNGLKVGDSLHLALRYANYAASPGRGGAEGRLSAKGGVYEPFEESDYTIRGIYDVGVGADGDWGYTLDRNEVFIPTASIKNSDENNIALHGPMKGYTTAFRIPNGSESIENYKKLWEAQGVDHVEITFYDGGYTKLEGGLKNMRTMSAVLLMTGIVSAVCIVIFFCHLFITKQKKQTAIERSLGMTRKQCVRSLLVGILVIALAGSAAGGFAGGLFAAEAVEEMASAETFGTRFSNGEVQFSRGESERKEGAAEDADVSGGVKSAYLTQTDFAVSAACGGLVFLFTVGMALSGIYGNLRQEPLKLLAEAESRG